LFSYENVTFPAYNSYARCWQELFVPDRELFVPLADVLCYDLRELGGKTMARESRTHLRFRIEPQLQKRLEAAQKKSGRTLTAEIAERLKQSFDIPDQSQSIASDVASEVSSELSFELSSIEGSVSEIQIQIRAILSHLGLPDPVEERKAAQRREAEARRARRAEAEKAAEQAIERIQRAKPPDASHPAETKDEDSK